MFRVVLIVVPLGQQPAYPYDPARATQLLAEAGYPKGFDAGDFWCDAATSRSSEAVLNYLQSAGIRIWQLAVLQGYGPRRAESGLGLITDYPWSAPYEDLRLNTR